MDESEPFVDYYEILQVSPDCSVTALRTAYRAMAKMYHPDHSETSDINRFDKVTEAYRILRDPRRRVEYDIIYAENRRDRDSHTSRDDTREEVDERVAISDSEAHVQILRHLYKRRREHAQEAGVGRYFLQQMLNCSDEHFEFHIWYLKAKGLIEITEQGTLAITIQGVDHTISMSRTTMAEKLLIAQSRDAAN